MSATNSSKRFARERWHEKLLEALRQQPPQWWRQTLERLDGEAAREGIVIYADPTTLQPVRIQRVPWLLTRAQARYLHMFGVRLRRALNRLLRTYFDDPAVQAVLPLSEDERAWLSALFPKGFPEPMPVFERVDTNLGVEDPHWAGNLRVLEWNSVGVGCLHFMPVANQLIADQVLPVLRETLAPASCRLSADPRVLLARLLRAHAAAIGRQTCVVAFVERREASPGGADEMLRLSEFLKVQGFQAVYVDPRELEVRNGEVVCHDLVVDLIYRDFMLNEIVSIERHGGQVHAIKHAFQRNQVVSALTGEFDHKSLLEFCSNPEFSRYFTPAQRRALATIAPWTRLMRERKTTAAAGEDVDLPAYARANRERLILKPNRSYGGQDVVIGPDATQAVWEEAIGRAMAHPDTWVVQAFIPLPCVPFPDPVSRELGDEFVTVGFIATPDGIAFVGRSSRERIVNISRGGSLVPIFLID